jgi:hypothetical protein
VVSDDESRSLVSSFLLRASLTVTLGLSAPWSLAAEAQETKEDQQEPPKEDPKEEEPPEGSGGAEAQSSSSGGGDWVGTEAPPYYEVSGHTGGFTTRVPIAVPSFHGVEPSLALTTSRAGETDS